MGKTAYVSKGQRPNVSRQQLIMGRAERRANPTVASMMASAEHKANILSRTKDKSIAPLREKYIEDDRVSRRAGELFKKYSAKGATYAACVQAVKTDWISSFENKYT